MRPGRRTRSEFRYGVEDPDTLARLAGQTVTGELGDPADMVPVVRFRTATAPETRRATAQTVYCNGG